MNNFKMILGLFMIVMLGSLVEGNNIHNLPDFIKKYVRKHQVEEPKYAEGEIHSPNLVKPYIQGFKPCFHQSNDPKFYKYQLLEQPAAEILEKEQTLKVEKAKRHKGEKGNFKPIRIMFDYSLLDQFSNKDLVKYVKNDLMRAVSAYLTNAISVFPLKKALKVHPNYQNNKCGPDNIQLSQSHITDGVPDTDLLIYVTAQLQNPQINAYSVICNQGIQNTNDGRETVGYINLNMQNLQKDINLGIGTRWTSTLIHEIIHTMAFNPFLFDKYRDENGYQMKLEKVIKKEKNRSYFIVQPLLDYAKQFFKCEQAVGVPIEDNGGTGSADFHFERTAFGYEAMTANPIGEDVFSNFTLKLMESTGWYMPNYTMAQPLIWGKGEGCDFLNADCPLNSKEFCKNNNNNYLTCAYDYSGIATCFNQDQFSPNCPYWRSYTNDICKNADTNAFIKDIKEYDGSVNAFGACIPTNIPSNDDFKIDKTLVQANCYTAFCTVTNGKLTNQQISVDSGIIYCPDVDQFCNFPTACANSCNKRGICQNGSCICYPGYSGIDCLKTI